MLAALSHVHQDGADLVITIRARKRWGFWAFMCLWLPLWALGEVFGASLLLAGETGSEPVSLFLVVWLIFWTYGGYLAIRSVLWTLLGREHIRLSVDRVDLTRRSLLLSRQHGLRRDGPLHLRLRDHRDRIYRGSDDGTKAIPDAVSFQEGQLMFVAADQKIGMGVDLDAEEAKRLATTLWAVFPELEPRP